MVSRTRMVVNRVYISMPKQLSISFFRPNPPTGRAKRLIHCGSEFYLRVCNWPIGCCIHKSRFESPILKQTSNLTTRPTFIILCCLKMTHSL
ncbi:uncharacterized protein DS421_1g25040 [Arachis hypogaea]|nr:uncharacterized protein DS421_1g25040 [Arachis hypogaea]